MSHNQEDNPVDLHLCVRTHGCSIERLPLNEELGVFEMKGVMRGVGLPMEIFAWEKKEEEGYPGKVADGLVLLRANLVRCVKSLEDGYWY